MPDIAPSNFVASMIEQVVPKGKDQGSFAWFGPPDGFETRYVVRNDSDAEVVPYNDWLKGNPKRPIPFVSSQTEPPGNAES